MATPAARIGTDIAVAPRPRGPGLKQVLGSDYRLGFLFVAPTVVLVLALVAYPFCYAVYLSMTQKFVGMPPVFVGLENYIRLAGDGFFQRAVLNSFTFTFWSVAIKLCLGMVMALVLMSKIRFRSLPQGVGWLSEPGTAMASVIFVNIWRGFPFFGISLLAGMKAISSDLYE